MKTIKSRSDESGQILLILTVGIVALVGIMALAIDGGMIYADRRFDQNAADASAFAGAGTLAMSLENQQVYHTNFSCSNSKVTDAIALAKDAAYNRAKSNYFTIDLNVDNQHGVEVYCHNSGGPFEPRYLDVYTMVSSELQTSFAHFFYKGPVRNTVDANVRVNLGVDAGYGYALASLSDKCDEGLLFKGGGSEEISVNLVGSGAHSNSCVDRNGKFKVISDKKVTYAAPQGSHSGYITNGSGWIKNKPADSAENIEHLNAKIPRPIFDEIVKECGDPKGSHTSKEAYKELQPGTYGTIEVANKQHVVLLPGVYCITENLTMTPSEGKLEGSGVTIVMLEKGVIKINSGETILKATSDVTKPYRNLLIYAVSTNTSTHVILGNAESYYEGTILFPYGNLEFGGSSGSEGNKVQVVANHIWLHGGGTLLMNYDNSMVWRTPSLVSLENKLSWSLDQYKISPGA
jgi:hypothetical protein